jgi:hypothetical protein
LQENRCWWGLSKLAAGDKPEAIVKFLCEMVAAKHLPLAGLVVVTVDTVAAGHQH